MTPLPYHPDIERAEPGEQDARSPAHGLTAHQPLGSAMRARLQAYRTLSAFRHRENGIPEENTAHLSQILA